MDEAESGMRWKSEAETYHEPLINGWRRISRLRRWLKSRISSKRSLAHSLRITHGGGDSGRPSRLVATIVARNTRPKHVPGWSMGRRADGWGRRDPTTYAQLVWKTIDQDNVE